MQLDDYFRRIGYTGPRAPDLETLKAIHLAHPAAIPFENIDPLFGRVPGLDAASLTAKLVEGGRGGWCFEHNALLRDVLVALGFEVTALAARVVWNAPPDRPLPPRMHMLLRIDLDGRIYLADVGFGGRIMTGPIEFLPGEPQPTPTGLHRIREDDDAYVMEAELPAGWVPFYLFSLEPHLAVDYEPGNWYLATHPRSLFVNNLLMERVGPSGRASLFNDRLVLRNGGEPVEIRLETPGEFAEALRRHFGLEIPAEELFERIPKGLDGPYMPGP